jgi:hypothetical protein
MEYIHIKKLEDHHPGYKDRKLQWAKIFFDMVNGDPEFEIIEDEVDKWRFVAMILLELNAQKPLLNDPKYWGKHFNIEKRPMALTLQMLHNFLEIKKECNVDKDKEEDKDKSKRCVTDTKFLVDFQHLKDPVFRGVFESFLSGRKKKATDHAKELILKDLSKHDLKTAISMLEQSIKNGWTGVFDLKLERTEYQKQKDNPSQSQVRHDPKPNKDCSNCGGSGKFKLENNKIGQCWCVS